MIALEKFEKAERLLALDKLSLRRIATMVGISRATVSAIAKGEYQIREVQKHAREDCFLPSGPVARCTTCGGLVQIPCLACRVEKLKELERQMLRTVRRKARERALCRLLHAVRQANWDRDTRERARVA